MMPLQIIAIVFSLFMMYVATIHRRKRHLELVEYLVWQLVWLGFISLVAWPNIFRGVTQSLQMDRVFDVIVVLALIAVLILTYTNRISYLQMRTKLERLIRDRAKENA